jgi:hypothetical protein
MNDPIVKSIEEAAARLGKPFTVDWLKGHMDEIPHVKVGEGRGRGGRVGFTDEHLAQIVAMNTVQPVRPAAPAGPITRRRAS